MKTILPWLLVLVTAGAAAFVYHDNQLQSAEITRLKSQVLEGETLRSELEQAKQSQIAPEELARLREAQDEVLRLRNQVRQLAADKSQLSQQTQAAQTAAAQAQAQAQAQVEAQTLLMAKTKDEIASATVPGCQHQLRQIAAAKQQWALEHHKVAADLPTDKDLAPYLAGQMILACPGGGKYTFGAVAEVPKCSVPGHVLPASE